MTHFSESEAANVDASFDSPEPIMMTFRAQQLYGLVAKLHTNSSLDSVIEVEVGKRVHHRQVLINSVEALSHVEELSSLFVEVLTLAEG